uniref:Transmembrane protein n=1 Tax=Neobodo designis TaxID=312471 RepID=A0A7S1M693_NEODS|mmetsp:Transcript_34698/g.107166  ORF Transcript_34698/g.107166 Transcript_34698/m.107166 type:complete len:194 (+) Transcript_34698:53-634(+)|eukprot:CAMPEP_0174855020 /NCGR_PEP_ID=MMETSP1114-20130205/32260_1 /TAXON_ID=312471 /ORGANISM="Neobodo designis, Strain CCAP 1951/1" /LENGTH=193 /DNA_ID=CAMNT_0016089731 /DNA_START=52 /DNA_END=633 /DNA_ORIENTATION=-
MDPLRGMNAERMAEMMKNMKMDENKKPDEPIPEPPEVPSLDAMGFLKTVQQSEHYNLVLLCFGCLFITTFVAVLIFMRLRRSGDADSDVKQKLGTIARYVEAVDTVRVEQEQLMKRVLREGRWPDHVKSQWDDDDRAMRRDFELRREPLVTLAGAEVQSSLKRSQSLFQQLVSEDVRRAGEKKKSAAAEAATD